MSLGNIGKYKLLITNEATETDGFFNDAVRWLWLQVRKSIVVSVKEYILFIIIYKCEYFVIDFNFSGMLP